MARRIAAVCLLCPLFSASVLGAEPSYLLQMKDPIDAARIRVRYEDSLKTNMKVIDDHDAVFMDKTDKLGARVVYKATAAERSSWKDERPEGVSLIFEKAQETGGFETGVLPCQGKTVQIAGKEGEYVFRDEEDIELNGLPASLLHHAFHRRDLNRNLVPRNPVRVGESWEVDPGTLAQATERCAVFIDVARATGKLLRTYSRKDHVFGVLEYSLAAPYPPFHCGRRAGVARDAGTLSGKIVIDACIDGALADQEVGTDLKFHWTEKFGDGKMIYEGTATSNYTVVELAR